jgi:hypothetical protein
MKTTFWSYALDRRAFSLLALLLLLVSSEAWAQSKLLIVPFEQEGDGVQALYGSIMEKVKADANASQDYRVSDTEVNGKLTDLLFEVGCGEVNPECLQLLAQSFGADALMWGKLWKNDRGILLEIRLFDAVSGIYVTEPPVEKSIGAENKPAEVEADAWYTNVVVGEFQQIFYPFSGEVTVATSEPGAKIFFDGSEVGDTSAGPVTLTGRPLGEHLISARIGDKEVTESVVLLKGEQPSITVDMSKADAPVVTDSGHIGSITSLSAGGAFLLGGVVMSFLVSGANDETKDLAGKPVLDATKANDLRNSGSLYQTLEFTFFGIGTAALITGGVLYFFVEDSGSSEPEQPATSFMPVPLEGGGGFVFEGRF